MKGSKFWIIFFSLIQYFEPQDFLSWWLSISIYLFLSYCQPVFALGTSPNVFPHFNEYARYQKWSVIILPIWISLIKTYFFVNMLICRFFKGLDLIRGVCGQPCILSIILSIGQPCLLSCRRILTAGQGILSTWSTLNRSQKSWPPILADMATSFQRRSPQLQGAFARGAVLIHTKPNFYFPRRFHICGRARLLFFGNFTIL